MQNSISCVLRCAHATRRSFVLVASIVIVDDITTWWLGDRVKHSYWILRIVECPAEDNNIGHHKKEAKYTRILFIVMNSQVTFKFIVGVYLYDSRIMERYSRGVMDPFRFVGIECDAWRPSLPWYDTRVCNLAGNVEEFNSSYNE